MRSGRSAMALGVFTILCSGCFYNLTALSSGGDRADGGKTRPDAGEVPPLPADGGGVTQRCTDAPGPTMVRIDAGVTAFCIDSTEVTNDQYAEFLAAHGKELLDQPPSCTQWNLTYQPALWPPGSDDGKFPVGGVDWCDARAYCAWAGKSLCGNPTGGPSTFADANDPAKDSWFTTCSSNGAHPYPYGDTYADVCNGNSGKLVGAGTKADCVALAHPEVLDLSGNVAEWVDTCGASSSGAAGKTDICLSRGGSFNQGGSADSTCATTGTSKQTRDAHDATRGFRCCSPLQN